MTTSVLISFAIGLGGTGLLQPVEFSVVHQHLLRDCRGTLRFDDEAVEYQTTHENDSRRWNYVEIAQLKLEPSWVEIVTYEDQRRLLGRDRIFRFRLVDGEIGPELADQLTSKVLAPVSALTAAPPAAEEPTYQIPVKHLHTWGGCQGTLRITSTGVAYQSDDLPDHSRYWRYSDLQHWGQPSRRQLQVWTYERQFGGPEKTFQFQLKRELPAGAYDYVWARLYPSAFDTRGGN